jgi:hypothetical protein
MMSSNQVLGQVQTPGYLTFIDLPTWGASTTRVADWEDTVRDACRDMSMHK